MKVHLILESANAPERLAELEVESIAQAIYGDANMTGPLYATNADQLADPRDLAPGQVLVLPRR